LSLCKRTDTSYQPRSTQLLLPLLLHPRGSILWRLRSPSTKPSRKEKNRGPQPKHRFSSHVFALGLTFLFLFVFSPTSFCRLRLPFASIILALG
jgi:hypothetical protein